MACDIEEINLDDLMVPKHYERKKAENYTFLYKLYIWKNIRFVY